jgi:serine/threonine protein phosphatase PrpC
MHLNQDNFFILIDGETKIYGLFDGHGVKGHLISSFAMGTMLDYIKNSKCFKDKNLYDPNGEPLPDADITKAIKLCFKYTQDRVREQYYDYLINEKKKKIVREKLNARMKEKEM